MNNDEIRRFLIEANKHGYGNLSVESIKESDGSKTITYVSGDWKFHDNYFGGEPFGGREVISYNGKVVWMMVYYDSRLVDDVSLRSEAYAFLKESLLIFPDEQPYRGPSRHENGEWLYLNKVEGNFENFWGEETISYKGRQIYRTRYQGGVVDR